MISSFSNRSPLVLTVWMLCASAAGQSGYHSYALYLDNDRPREVENYWSHEAQGIAHDDSHWYLTQDVHLWRVPVGDDLASQNPGAQVRHLALRDTFLWASGYDHFGDLEHHDHQGTGYLFIPITGPGRCNAVAAFRAADLSLIDFKCVAAASWATLDAAGRLYVGRDEGLVRYNVRWDLLPSNVLALENETSIPVFNESGGPIGWTHPQGGDFSDDGQLLYVTTGFPGAEPADHGIHVIDTTTWRRVRRSTNGTLPFSYQFDPSAPASQEPEGLTVWDLDDGRAPGVAGQLHVLLLDNDFPDDDDVYLKNYTHTIYVDGGHAGAQNGRPFDPFITVAAAHARAWSGSRISIRARAYPENLTLNKRVRITARGGIARIGSP